MIRNIQYFRDLITIDFNLKEIRYLKGYFDGKKEGIEFFNITNTEVNILEYCNDDKTFIKRIKDILNDMNIKIELSGMRVLK